jgi:serine/threonine-protein kinase RsbW
MDGTVAESEATGWYTEIGGGLTAACVARELLSDRFGDTTPADTMHDLHLLATELVTNAVLHAGVCDSDTIEMRVVQTTAGTHVSVTDPGAATTPRVQELDPYTPGGMGLFLVDQISSAWGVERMHGGENRVWFELAA